MNYIMGAILVLSIAVILALLTSKQRCDPTIHVTLAIISLLSIAASLNFTANLTLDYTDGVLVLHTVSTHLFWLGVYYRERFDKTFFSNFFVEAVNTLDRKVTETPPSKKFVTASEVNRWVKVEKTK